MFFRASAHRFRVRRIFAYAHRIYRHNALFLVGIILSVWSIAVGTQLLAYVLFRDVSLYAGAGMGLVGFVFSVLLGMGAVAISLRLVRRQHTDYEDLMEPAPAIMRYIIGDILYHVIVLMGLVLLVVPGIVWAIKYMFFRHLIVDHGLDPLDALYVSGEMTEGHKVKLFALSCALAVFNLLGFCALGFGLLYTVPVAKLVRGRVYDRLVSAHEYEIYRLTRARGLRNR